MRRVVVAGVAIAVLWTAWVLQRLIFYIFDIDWTPDRFGQWGDTFGALSSLFSAGAFLGAIYAISQQQLQIDQARSDQRSINQETMREQHRHRFETTFFEMLKLLREVRNEIEFKHDGWKTLPNGNIRKHVHIYKGGEALRIVWGQLIIALGETEGGKDRAAVGRLYNDIVNKEYEYSFSPYFRLMYAMLVRIRDDAHLTSNEKDDYARLLRSQLTSYDLTLAGINGLSSMSGDFAVLLTDFKMFKHIPAGYRLRTLKLYYSEDAFSSRD